MIPGLFNQLVQLLNRWAFPLIMLLSGVLLWCMLNPFLTIVNHDSAIFCILAQSILKGHYLLVSEPNPQPYFTFPPLLSLQLAALMKLFGTTDIQAMQPVFKGYIDLLFWLSLPVFYSWLNHMLKSRRDALVLTGLLAINPIIFKYSSDVLSDTPYWSFSMLALYSFWQLSRESQPQNQSNPLAKTDNTIPDVSRIKWFIVALFMAIACALLRQIGLSVVLTFWFVLTGNRAWKKLLVSLVVVTLTVGGWQSYEHFYRLKHRSDISSLNQQGVQSVLDRSPVKLEYIKHFLVDRPVNLDQNRLQNNPVILLSNIRDRLLAYSNFSLEQLIPRLKYGSYNTKQLLSHHPVFLLLLWLLLALGIPASWRQCKALPVYVGVYMAVLWVYPYISIRFLLPVFPFIQLFVYLGVLKLVSLIQASRITSPVWYTSAGVVLFLLLAMAAQLPATMRWVVAGYQLKIANQGPSLRTGNAAYYRTLLWIKANTPSNSLIISRKPPVVYFYANRHATAFPFTANKKELFSYIQQKYQASHQSFPFVYLFEDQVFGSSQQYLTPAVQQYQNRLKLVYTEPQTHSKVWLLKPESLQQPLF
jgi:4-amino-4-deoxy-L-arabinose transferase-like glycosyltransferase